MLAVTVADQAGAKFNATGPSCGPCGRDKRRRATMVVPVMNDRVSERVHGLRTTLRSTPEFLLVIALWLRLQKRFDIAATQNTGTRYPCEKKSGTKCKPLCLPSTRPRQIEMVVNLLHSADARSEDNLHNTCSIGEINRLLSMYATQGRNNVQLSRTDKVNNAASQTNLQHIVLPAPQKFRRSRQPQSSRDKPPHGPSLVHEYVFADCKAE
jgi:hypothetical protein